MLMIPNSRLEALCFPYVNLELLVHYCTSAIYIPFLNETLMKYSLRVFCMFAVGPAPAWLPGATDAGNLPSFPNLLPPPSPLITTVQYHQSVQCLQ